MATTEELAYLNELEREREAKDLKLRDSEIANYQQSLALQKKDSGMIKEQLDLSGELTKIEHLLKGEIQTKDKWGQTFWEKPKDRRMIILSDYGVEMIMNILQFYLNKNTLLANYEEETILQKMEDFSTSFADYVFMHYESIFEQPSFEDCKKILVERIEKRKELRKFASELLSHEFNEENFKEEMVKEMEGKIEQEIGKIRDQLKKDRLKRFEIILRTIQDTVHSTYQRSWKGQERTTLRQHIHVTESKGGSGLTVRQPQVRLNPLSWLTKK